MHGAYTTLPSSIPPYRSIDLFYWVLCPWASFLLSLPGLNFSHHRA
jgi:hypothetical protein